MGKYQREKPSVYDITTHLTAYRVSQKGQSNFGQAYVKRTLESHECFLLGSIPKSCRLLLKMTTLAFFWGAPLMNPF